MIFDFKVLNTNEKAAKFMRLFLQSFLVDFDPGEITCGGVDFFDGVLFA